MYEGNETDPGKADGEAMLVVAAVVILALALFGGIVWLSYAYADPILAALGRVLN